MRLGLKQTITNEQKELILQEIEQDKQLVKQYYQLLLVNNNRKNQLYFIEQFTEYSALYRLVDVCNINEHELLWAMYDAVTENIHRDTPLLSVKELKELHDLV